ncbi:MAG: translocation/assembly module TamB domain-containing protein, partial [bacterium]|nr:translocation/assembly module TamB domain-containing protein [bacterium]
IKNLQIIKIQADKANIEFCYFDKLITLSKIYLTQKSGFLELEKGNIYLDSEKDSFLNINLNNFRFPNTFLSGKVELLSKNNFYENKYDGNIKVADLILNKRFKLKNIYSQFSYNKNILHLSNYDKEASILGKINFSLPRKIIINELCYVKDGLLFLKCNGNIFPKKEELNINIQAFDPILKIIPEYTKIINSSNGKLSANMSIKGTFDQYRINGNLNLEEGEMVTSWKHFNKYTNIQAEIIFKDYQIKLKKLRFNLNEGIISSHGNFIIPEKKINIHLSTEKYIKAYIPLKIDTNLLANLRICGNYDTPTCKGTVELFDTNFTYDTTHDTNFTYTKKLRKKKKHILNNIFFNLKLLAKNKVKYYNNYAKCSIVDNSWIKLSGYPGKFKVIGTVTSHKGYIEYLGTRFLINQAKLEFKKGEKTPYLFGEAQANVGNTLIIMSYYGKLFASEPTLTTPNIYPSKTKDEIVRMLRLGRDYKDIKSNEIDTLLRIGLARIIGVNLSSNIIRPLESNLAKLLKVDVDIRIPYLNKILLKKDEDDSQELKKDISDETVFNFGKYITDDLYFNYRGALSGQKKENILSQEFELEYQYKPGEIFRYKYLPKINGTEEKEHEISIKKDIKF